MTVSFLSVAFLGFGGLTLWSAVYMWRHRHALSSYPTLAGRLARVLVPSALAAGGLAWTVMGVVMLWYPADRFGHIHPPDGSIADAAENVAILMMAASFALFFAWMVAYQTIQRRGRGNGREGRGTM
jgi:hypothetical protein